MNFGDRIIVFGACLLVTVLPLIIVLSAFAGPGAWVLFVSGIVIADSAIGKTLRDGLAGPVVISVVKFVGFALFFWWSMHFLLGGRESWRRGLPGCCRHRALLGGPRRVRCPLLLLDDCF